MHPEDSEDKLLESGRFLEFRAVGTWEYFQRRNVKGCVAILAVTDDRKVVLVEQYRPPIRIRTTGRKKVVGRGGFEPPLLGPKPRVLPLDDRPVVRRR